MVNIFTSYINKIKGLLSKELELAKLKALRSFSDVLSYAFLLIFMTIFFNTLIIVSAIWLGFFLSALLESTVMGFGLAALAVLFLLLIVLIFRRQLIVNPFRGAIMRFYLLQNKKLTKADLPAQNEKE
jgi:hypothetical protein